MPAKRKTKPRSDAKSAKKAKRQAKTKTARKPASKQTAGKRPSSKAKVRTRKKAVSVNPEKELKREFQNRKLAGGSKSSSRALEDFEGVSRVEQADSESVDELVEEGNLFEAGAVAGVEEADDADEREVRTHELPEDDVPEEYDDKE